MTWTPEAHANANWTVRQSGSVRRISESALSQARGRRRLTEAGAVRIIDRYEIRWNIPLSSPDPWHPS